MCLLTTLSKVGPSFHFFFLVTAGFLVLFYSVFAILTTFKCNNSGTIITFTVLYNNHYYLLPKIFTTHQKETLFP